MKNLLLKVGIVTFGLLFVASCNQVNSSKATENSVSAEYQLDTNAVVQNGKELVKVAFNTLSGELKAAMKRGGAEEAVNYCNVSAYSLTDSLSTHFNAKIKRTSHKVRNAANSPDALEEKVLAMYLDQFEKGQPLEPSVQVHAGKTRYFHPITLAAACLSCHGQPNTEIQPKTMELIAQRYPMDKATGFTEGDFRGIWSITFEN